tara:strand:- start:740 stop:934 length:195 start_codon:yes stop_codon:yes gene_type:complete
MKKVYEHSEKINDMKMIDGELYVYSDKGATKISRAELSKEIGKSEGEPVTINKAFYGDRIYINE